MKINGDGSNKKYTSKVLHSLYIPMLAILDYHAQVDVNKRTLWMQKISAIFQIYNDLHSIIARISSSINEVPTLILQRKYRIYSNRSHTLNRS